MNLFFIVFQSFVLLPNLMSKLIDNRCACKLIMKITAAYVYAHEQYYGICVFMFLSIIL